MKRNTVNPSNARGCLLAIAGLIEQYPGDSQELCDAIDAILDELVAEDAFGTEAQLDPRGDQRG